MSNNMQNKVELFSYADDFEAIGEAVVFALINDGYIDKNTSGGESVYSAVEEILENWRANR